MRETTTTPSERLSHIREERFMQVLQAVRQEARKRRWMALPSKNWWEEVRDGLIAPALMDAAKALCKFGYSANQVQKNGGSGTMLEIDVSGDSLSTLHLTFALSGDEIRITSSEPELNEVWDQRGFVSEECVLGKVEQFIRVVAGKYPEPLTGKGPLRS